jgi:amino acid adenylation domain-containing protein
MSTSHDASARAAGCHSLVLRIPTPVDADRVRGHLAEAASRRPEYGGLRIWERRIVRDGDYQVGKEATRPVLRAGPLARIVLARHADGAADLVLVAHRSRLSKAGLTGLAVLLTGGTETDAGTAGATPIAPLTPRPDWPEVPWGLGDRRDAGAIGEVSIGAARGDETVLLAATALVLARYDPDQQPRLGIWTGDAFATVSFDVAEQTSIADYLDLIAGGCGATAQLRDGAPVGVLFDEFGDGYTYRPCLAPVYPLTFYWERRDDGLFRGRCWYDRGSVSPAIAAQFASHVGNVADCLATSVGDRPLAGIDLMTVEERDEVLRSGATAPVRGHGPRRIDQRFTEIATRQPDAPAVSDGDTTLSYRELDALGHRLAAGLRALGVSAGDRVGVCLERGISLVAALLAVLKTDGVYVPMDVRHPAERLRYIATDAGVSVLIAESDLPSVEGVRRVTLEWLERRGDCADSAAGSLADGPAYAIYTSGSTGRPKGVLVSHANVTALIRATEGQLALGPADVWTFFHSSAFDFSVWEIWGCLLTGGHLVVVSYWASRSPVEFRRLLAGAGVTVLSQTPSAFGQLIAADRTAPASDVLRLRLVVLGGEGLDTRMLARWFARYSPTACRVVNMFGITETTVHVTMHSVTPLDAERGSRSVGHAIPGWSVSVRDGSGRILPYGASGEIHVGGAGVALGYLGQPELTAERFTVDDTTGLRTYRSGDRGRLRPDGSLDHLGRCDSQVKVRGHRIELDEIRAVLMDDPSVIQAAVVLVDDDPSDTADTRIAAYAVLKPGATPRAVLRNCAALLPDYMVPATLTEVVAMPLTPNGKLDSQQLPAPTVTSTVDESSGPAEDGVPLVERVRRLWSRHLRTAVGADDSFFEAGGNSILVVRVLAELKSLGMPAVTVPQFYRHSTVTQFSALLDELIARAGGPHHEFLEGSR